MKKFVLLSLSVVMLLAAGIGLLGKDTQVNAAMTELSIEKMTCGSCVSTITEALEGIPGVRQIDILVTTGRGQVLYDPAQVDAQSIARTVTESGFPAAIRLDLSSADYQALKAEESRLAEKYLAKVGTRLISRDDFEVRLQQALATMQLTNQPEAAQQIRSRLWQDIQDREILLASAEMNQVVVQQGEVEHRLQKLREQTPDFDATVLPAYGGEKQFVQRLKEDMIISRNIEDNVVVGIDDPAARREKLNLWYRQLVEQTPVVIFDPQLKQLAAGSGSGCGSGGGCCSS